MKSYTPNEEDKNDEETPLIVRNESQTRSQSSLSMKNRMLAKRGMPLNIVHFSTEFAPQIWGGLGLATAGIATTQFEKGHNVVVIIPYTQTVQLHGTGPRIISSIDITLPSGKVDSFLILKTESREGIGLPVYFIHHPVLNGKDLYSYSDNMHETYHKLILASLEVIKRVIFPNGLDIFHCHDWPTALGGYLLRLDPFFNRTASIFTVHNFAHQCILSIEDALRIGLDSSLFNDYVLARGCFSVLRVGLIFSDHITTVSQSYRDETLGNVEGCGNEDVLRQRAKEGEYEGILNGIEDRWNPKNNPNLVQSYDADTFVEAKRINKLAFQKQHGLAQDISMPLIVSVARITHQKGLDFILENIKELIQAKVQIVIIGNVTPSDEIGVELQTQFKKYAEEFPQLVMITKFTEVLEHQADAAADIFYMGSRYEPGGLANQHAARYGAVVVGTSVGGIKDAIVDYRTDPKRATGFLASRTTSTSVGEALFFAIKLFRTDKTAWNRLIVNSMNRDCSWRSPVDKYIQIYYDAVNKRSSNSATHHEDDVASELAEIVSHSALVFDKDPDELAEEEANKKWYYRIIVFDFSLVFRSKELFKSCITTPGRADFISYFIVDSVSTDDLTVIDAITSIVWYQMQDIIFTLFGQTYMKFLGKMTHLLKIFGVRVGDIFFVFWMLFTLEFLNRLILGPLGDNPSAYSFNGIGLILWDIFEGMVSGGPIDPAINKLRESGFVSHRTAMHLYQIAGFTMLFGLFATFGYQTIYSLLTGSVFVLSFVTYVTFTFFRNPAALVRGIYNSLSRTLCCAYCANYDSNYRQRPPNSLAEVNLVIQSNLGYSPSPEDWSDEFIYSIMIDRFNISKKDIVKSRRNKPRYKYERHGGNLQGIIEQLEYIQELGVTAILISPIQTNSIESYHGYAPIHLMAVDPQFGNMQDFRRLVREAHGRGIRIILDITTNHCGPVFEYEIDSKWVDLDKGHKKIGKWKYEIKPTELANEENFSRCGEICDWNDEIQIRNGDFPPNLRRFATKNAETQRILLDIMCYWIKESDIDGFRLDAIKHLHPNFVENVSKNIKDYAARLGKHNFLLLAENSSGIDTEILPFLVTTGSAYNYPDYRRVNYALHSKSATRDIELSIRENALVFGSYMKYVVRFLDNHDVYRFLRTNESIDILYTGLSYLMLSVGIPMLYYGSEQAFRQNNDNLNPESSENPADPDNREDMFQGPSDGMSAPKNNFDKGTDTYLFIKRLADLRKAYPIIRRGTEVVRWSDPTGPGLIAFSRIYLGKEALVIINTSEYTRQADIFVDFNISPPDTEFQDALDMDYIVTCRPSMLSKTSLLSINVRPRGQQGVRVLVQRNDIVI